MHQFIALYRQPDDEAAFMKHYTEVHTPLVQKIPGLQSLQVTRLERNPMGGAPEFFLMAVMTYPDADTFKAAMNSPENAAAGKDLMGFAAGTVTLMTGRTLR
ncbi:EthD family reductase [Deinococcus maricopensis]|uniref:Ethyl tert-butyl ether degradation EthD n=1 Tax=Deinococcus maricopensis (strain DSM 21211 / LMG 22137 / NRRL B-23946 / LB-34) TaxID=709986 RepID=E8U6U1_DEIML|nr:EthD family reductase [Deinococcus maricopensis]ADV66780.1 Ethyl tert-butyl ether degradation EthD [Deinococcus maricopensis DSM 21211]